MGTAEGERVGQITITPEQIIESALDGPNASRLLRLATTDDLRLAARLSGAGSKLLESLDLPTWAVDASSSKLRRASPD